MILFERLMEFVGLEPGRLEFSWISASEGEQFAKKATEITERIRALGPNTRLRKQLFTS